MAATSRELEDHVVELLAPLGPVSAGRMFGGVGIRHDGTMFGLIADGTLYLRVDDASRPRFEAAGARPFSYGTRRGRVTVASYFSVPEALLDAPESLVDWARGAVAAAASAASAKPLRRRPR